MSNCSAPNVTVGLGLSEAMSRWARAISTPYLAAVMARLFCNKISSALSRDNCLGMSTFGPPEAVAEGRAGNRLCPDDITGNNDNAANITNKRQIFIFTSFNQDAGEKTVSS